MTIENVNVFLTGGTGSVGLELLRLALRAPTWSQGRVLIRAATDEQVQARWRELLARASGGSCAAESMPHLQPVRGDITQPGLGLSERDREWLRTEATHVLHVAARTDFNTPRPAALLINTEGTRHVLDEARQMRRLVQFAHVSTLFVAGRRTGVVFERELEHHAGFVNTYEESKYEAERLVRAAMPSLPIATYRLSLLLGRASDGYVHQYLEAHKLFEFFLAGRSTRLVGAPGHTLDVLPTDYATEVLWRLFFEHFQPGQTCQVSAAEAAPSLADIAETFRRYTHRPELAIEWIYEPEWREILETDSGVEHGVSAAAQWMFEITGDYLLKPKLFRRDETDRALGEAAPPRPAFAEYLPRILDRCVAEEWGRTTNRVNT